MVGETFRISAHHKDTSTRGAGLLEQRLRQGARRLGRVSRVLARRTRRTGAARRVQQVRRQAARGGGCVQERRLALVRYVYF